MNLRSYRGKIKREEKERSGEEARSNMRGSGGGAGLGTTLSQKWIYV